MAQTVSIFLFAEERARLSAVIGDRNLSQKHARRARIILHSGERMPVLEIARRSGVSRSAVWRWQQRYAEQGLDGLLRDKTRKPGRAPLPLATVAKVLALPCSPAPGNATHWTGRAAAKAVGVSLRASSASGTRIGFNPIACAPSNCPRIPPPQHRRPGSTPSKASSRPHPKTNPARHLQISR